MPTPPPDSAPDAATATGPITTLPPPPEFLAAAGELGIEFEPTDVPRLGRYLQMLLEANRTTNLTAITDPAEAWRKHILDA
ncbi:MAG: class I SAM-dependent methyltransferase, partial [Phycisphaerales bacterium]|nr:class I SAM-dependent methyltransferase [Phycisphaerales bacterium]